MRFVRNGGGSPSIVCLILIFLSVSLVYAASIPAPRRDSASIEGNLTRRADSPLSLSEDSDEAPEINYDEYVAMGGAILELLKASDKEATDILRHAGRMQPGQPLASKWTDANAFRSNGWNSKDETPDLLEFFSDNLPFVTAFRSLGISDKARPQGKVGLMKYKHTLPWLRGGQSMQVSPCLSSARKCGGLKLTSM
jgi:hypothetical protein